MAILNLDITYQFSLERERERERQTDRHRQTDIQREKETETGSEVATKDGPDNNIDAKPRLTSCSAEPIELPLACIYHKIKW